jgi:hypothetical protein
MRLSFLFIQNEIWLGKDKGETVRISGEKKGVVVFGTACHCWVRKAGQT